MAPRSSGTATFGNRLLDATAPKVLDRFRSHLETVLLQVNQTIQKPGETIKHVFFPTHGLISIVITMKDGSSVEVGMVGNEGMFSVSALLGDDRPPQNAMVQLPGGALRMPSQLLRQEA
jgi:CRP-like cAMP-binding protein